MEDIVAEMARGMFCTISADGGARQAMLLENVRDVDSMLLPMECGNESATKHDMRRLSSSGTALPFDVSTPRSRKDADVEKGWYHDEGRRRKEICRGSSDGFSNWEETKQVPIPCSSSRYEQVVS